MATLLGNVILTLERLGVYDVILPFLLVFSVVFAILEKTRVLGTEKVGGEPYSRKSLNSIVAFVSAFFVIASAQLVAIITTVSSQMVILMLVIVFFMLLVGAFYHPGAETKRDELFDKWAKGFAYVMVVAIVAMFLNAIPYSSNQTWLAYAMGWLSRYGNSSSVGAILLIIFVIAFMYWIGEPAGEGGKPKGG